jgi:hypothetical protein
MKNKSKVILGLSSILAVSAGVAGVSTFAWFTTQRTASATVASLSVHSRDGSISLKAGTVDNGGITTTSTSYSYAASLTGTGSMNDVSSADGKKFYHPNWKAGKEGVEAGSITEITSNTSPTALSFREFTLTFKNGGTAGTDNAFDIYLTAGSKIEGATSDAVNQHAATAMRMAILDSTKTTLLAYWQYGVEGVAAATPTAVKPYQYNAVSMTADTGAKTAYTIADHYLVNQALNTKATLGTSGTTCDFADVNTATADQKAKQKITTSALAAGDEVTVDVRFWIEGTADVCTTSDADGGIAQATLQFAAL